MMPKKKAKRRGAVPPPKCKAILLCDQTIIEAGTGKVSVIGVFDSFMLPKVPFVSRPCTVFVQLADGIGSHTVEVEVHDLTNGVVIAKGAVGPEIAWPERPGKHNLLIPLPPLPISHVGEYDLVIFARNQEIDRQKFTVAVVPPPPEQQASEEIDHE
jgi:hypothetical protein